MSWADGVFWLLAAVALLTGWRVFRTDSMVRASFLLLASFIAVGAMMLMLGAAYLGFATIFMMAVEMMVMALFMVMFMMNPAGLNPMVMVHQHGLAIVAGLVTFAGLSAFALSLDLPDRPLPGGAEVIAPLGRELLGPSMLVFESAGVTLLATMLCVVILSSRSGRFGPSDLGSVPPAVDPAIEEDP
ncbi:MAG: NADH-quinone oxidoreductase subunit J [Thiohalocapsa sp.]|jgi:NADH:ubiquinone oxidoreductase subunit 6 (subunit J)|uniref:NADH-quinone oxidoreductase subunit J family protein n=1 Tax=Thiohalocapsa sp. TaxID=2497641 RepID=UPI0025D1B82E|nr:NADH-quinone oxidoreductase subunit J [Thiohalocapsa sp.]MCG6941654.1 NADH-quinone oxidoreductase subunit J [Thiohalocapsa sp.]